MRHFRHPELRVVSPDLSLSVPHCTIEYLKHLSCTLSGALDTIFARGEPLA